MVARAHKADGTCVIDIFHKGGVVVDTASYLLISRAAEKLYGNCVAIGAQRTQGGYIRDIGTHHSSSLVVYYIASSYSNLRASYCTHRMGRTPQHNRNNLSDCVITKGLTKG